jgi:hypothetical protein
LKTAKPKFGVLKAIGAQVSCEYHEEVAWLVKAILPTLEE